MEIKLNINEFLESLSKLSLEKKSFYTAFIDCLFQEHQASQGLTSSYHQEES